MALLSAVVCTDDAALAETLAAGLRPLAERVAVLKDASALTKAPDGPRLAIVDPAHLDLLGPAPPRELSVVALTNRPIQTSVEWFLRYPWLTQVLSRSAIARGQTASLLAGMTGNLYGPPAEWGTARFLGPQVRGRRVLFHNSGRIEERLDRIEAFAEAHGAGPRSISLMRDLSGEMLSNAFYDAPYEAGAFPGPIDRSREIELPREKACEVFYGVAGEIFFVRVRDAFGSLRRDRLLDVLSRCAKAEGGLGLDQSRGGAGLGLWRVFKGACLIVLSVVPGWSTEMLVGVVPNANWQEAQRCKSTHLFFREPPLPAEIALRQDLVLDESQSVELRLLP